MTDNEKQSDCDLCPLGRIESRRLLRLSIFVFDIIFYCLLTTAEKSLPCCYNTDTAAEDF